MPQGGFFYLDPPPTQRSPSAPIPAQGDQPPRIGRSLSQVMALILASWPTGMEPGLPQPDHHQSRIAPLALTYGQQPPRSDSYQRTRHGVVVSSWPTGMEPGLPQPDHHQSRTAPLTLTYGQQPPPRARMSDPSVLAWVMRTWEPPTPIAQNALQAGQLPGGLNGDSGVNDGKTGPSAGDLRLLPGFSVVRVLGPTSGNLGSTSGNLGPTSGNLGPR